MKKLLTLLLIGLLLLAMTGCPPAPSDDNGANGDDTPIVDDNGDNGVDDDGDDDGDDNGDDNGDDDGNGEEPIDSAATPSEEDSDK